MTPPTSPGVLRQLVGLAATAEAMGLLSPHEAAAVLEGNGLDLTLARMAQAGIGRAAVAALRGLLARPHGHPDRLLAPLRELAAALEDSPLPDREWASLQRVFEAEQAARLLDVSLSSLRRYASAVRRTPAEVAGRLHWLALVVGDLAGSYNHLGVRRWFDRKRTLLGGRSPAELLSRRWSPDDRGASRVRQLAKGLLA